MADHLKEDEGLFIIPEEEPEVPDVPKYLLPSKAYDILKWVGLILCYALAILTRKVGATWHIDVADQVADTIEAIGLFIGMCIGASQLSSMGR